MRLIDLRQMIADALNTVEDLNIRPRGAVKVPKQGDGWVTISRVEPADYTRCLVAFDVLIVLSGDPTMAEELVDTWSAQIIDAVTTYPQLYPGTVALVPLTLVVDQTAATLYALSLTLTHEVEA